MKRKAYKYRIDIYESLLSYAHRDKFTINEIHIPSIGVGINIQNGSINIFKTSSDRYKGAKAIREFEIDEQTVNAIELHIKNLEELKNKFIKARWLSLPNWKKQLEIA